MSEVRLFEVGGHIRDGLMGIESKDIDYSVEAESFEAMLKWVEETHAKVFLVTPDKFTVRALAKSDPGLSAFKAMKQNLVRDYVLCRKEGPYSDGRRPDWVKVGTLEDDLLRRDFTVNALARELGSDKIIDIVGGVKDIKDRKLKCVGSAYDRFAEDSLRIVRAIRFVVTKGFLPDKEIESILLDGHFADSLSNISVNRRREELEKCMKFHTVATLKFLGEIHPIFTEAIFATKGDEQLWLKPTMKGR